MWVNVELGRVSRSFHLTASYHHLFLPFIFIFFVFILILLYLLPHSIPILLQFQFQFQFLLSSADLTSFLSTANRYPSYLIYALDSIQLSSFLPSFPSGTAAHDKQITLKRSNRSINERMIYDTIYDIREREPEHYRCTEEHRSTSVY